MNSQARQPANRSAIQPANVRWSICVSKQNWQSWGW